MKPSKTKGSDANGAARPKRKLELRQRTLRMLTTEQLLAPVGGVTGIKTVCSFCPY
jgi:hypothetical protein